MRKSMTLEHRVKLKKNHVRLVNEMQLEYMMSYLVQEGILTFDMEEKIRSARTSYAMNEILMKMLPRRGDSAYAALVNALRLGSGQPHLVELLENTPVHIHEVAELEDELNRGSRRTSYAFSSCDGEETSSPAPHTPSPNTSRLVLQPIKKGKQGRKSRIKQTHREELPDISDLFPYITPHIYQKWQQLAVALGLTDVDMAAIVVSPHERQSRYVHHILEIWLSKQKTRATKRKLTEALQAIGAKKALDAIAIYDVPKFKAKTKRKPSAKTFAMSSLTPTKLPEIITTDATDDEKTTYMNYTSDLRRSGHLPIKCRIESLRTYNEIQTIDQSQKAFLNLADKLTNTMVDQGEQATQILNNIERLHGIVFHRVFKGSVILETQVTNLEALEQLMILYTSNELVTDIEKAFVTPKFLSKHNLRNVSLTVDILPADYELCKRELTAIADQCKEVSEAESETDGCCTTDESDESASEAELAPEKDDNHLIERCAFLIKNTRQELMVCLIEFDKVVSDLLMTLQLVHPPDVTRIYTIEDLLTFRGYVDQHPAKTLSTSAIDHFLQVRQQFINEIGSLKHQISSALYVAKDEGRLTSQSLRVEACIDELTSIQRMLQPNYNFSSLTHPHTVQMTTMETLCYRGMLACHYVILDKLGGALTICSLQP